MSDVVLFDRVVIRVKQLAILLSSLSFILANHFDWLVYLHLSKVTSDRLEFFIIILVALNRPAGYVDTASNVSQTQEVLNDHVEKN